MNVSDKHQLATIAPAKNVPTNVAMSVTHSNAGAIEALVELHEDAKLCKNRHFIAATRRQRSHVSLAISVIILSTLVGSLLIELLQSQPPPSWVHWVASGLTFLAAILTGIQTIFDFRKLAEGHRSIANRYLVIARRCKFLVVKEKDGPSPCEELWRKVEELRESYEEINAEAEAFPTRTTDYERARNKESVTPIFLVMTGQIGQTNAVSIRPATSQDADLIATIAASVNFCRYSHKSKGFIVHALSPAEYRHRICDGQCVYVLLVDGQLVGYVCGYDRLNLERYLQDATLSYESNVCRTVQQLADRRGDKAYTFLDQIALYPNYQDLGFGEQFFVQFCHEVDGPFYVAMVEAPLENPRIAYWVARGFIRLGNALETVPERFLAKDVDEAFRHPVCWGIYVLPRYGFKPVRVHDKEQHQNPTGGAVNE